MATIEQRYEHAVAYIHRAVDVVQDGSPSFDPLTRAIDWYAGTKKTETTRNDLEKLEREWMFARNDIDRAHIAREAELLADRVKEHLPGAPQDWKRTNLVKDEKERSTPKTSFEQEMNNQAHSVFGWAKKTATTAATGASSLGKFLLIGGGVLLAIKAVDLLRERDRGGRETTQRRLSTNLERSAERNAAARRTTTRERSSSRRRR